MSIKVGYGRCHQPTSSRRIGVLRLSVGGGSDNVSPAQPCSLQSSGQSLSRRQAQAGVDFAADKLPFGSCPQVLNKLLECRAVFGPVFEPCEEIESPIQL
jgi:hypothetical protein